MNTTHQIRAKIVASVLPTRALILILLLVVCTSIAPAQSNLVGPSPSQLVNAVVTNELADRLHHGKWMYRVQRRDGGRNVIEEQVETKFGPLARRIAINSRPLTPSEQQEDENRIRALLQDASGQRKLKRDYEEDERKLQNLMRVLPNGFLYDFEAIEGTVARLRFHPNPAYDPPTYEARIAHNMSGVLLINVQQMRLVRLSGKLSERVDIGYGLLGRIDKGGSIEVARVQVSPSQWKTSLIDIQLSGKVVLFKTIRKQEFQLRSDFRAVPEDLSLSDARKLLFRP